MEISEKLHWFLGIQKNKTPLSYSLCTRYPLAFIPQDFVLPKVICQLRGTDTVSVHWAFTQNSTGIPESYMPKGTTNLRKKKFQFRLHS